MKILTINGYLNEIYRYVFIVQPQNSNTIYSSSKMVNAVLWFFTRIVAVTQYKQYKTQIEEYKKLLSYAQTKKSKKKKKGIAAFFS